MPGDKYASIQHPRQYRALRRRGFSKEAAARISNARTPGHTVKGIVKFPGETLRDAIVNHLSLDLEEEQRLDSVLTRLTGKPAYKDSGVAPLAIPPTGPHALFNQPGVGIRSTRRRRRLKEFNWGAQVGQTISGNLTRGEGGRFSSSGEPSARQTMSAAQRKRRDAVRAKRQARAAERAAAHEQELAQEEATRADEDEYIAAGATGRERQRRRAEIAAKRRQRSTARREARRQEAAAERATRQQEDEQEQVTRAEEEAKPKGGGGGGGGKAKPTDDERQAEQQKKRAENRKTTAPKAGLRAEEADALAMVAEGGQVDEAQIDNLAELGLIAATGDNQFEATDAGRRALAALERGDVRGALAAIQDGKAKLERDAARAAGQQARDEAKKKRDAERSKRDRERTDAQKRRADERAKRDAERTAGQKRREQEREDNRRRREQQGRERTPILAAQIIRNLAERRQRRRRKELAMSEERQEKSWMEAHQVTARWEASIGQWVATQPSFTVFKDATGADRWMAISSTAYRDKDGEIVSSGALKQAVAAGDASGYRGPLRFWHVPGVELGDCDFQSTAYDGRILVESGTFRRPGFAAALKARGAGYQVSIGFVHPGNQPDADGVFTSISIFERSIVPPGRASNPFTSITTKEERMTLPVEKDDLLATLLGGRETEEYKGATSTIERTDKAAQDAKVAYKEAPAWAQTLIGEVQALSERVKAFEAKAPMPPEEMVEAGATEMADGVEELADETVDEGASDLLDDEGFADLIVSKLLAQLGPLLEIEKKMASWAGEIKAALPQMAQQAATKDDARAKEIADLQARLKELEGGQPRGARSLTSGVWGDLTGIPVTKEQAGQLTAQQPGAQAPAGLNGVEADAYKLIFGNE